MPLEIAPVNFVYRYNGVTLEAPAGASVDQVRKLHSAIHRDLINAEPDFGPMENGRQVITFRVARLRDKGSAEGSFAQFKAEVRALAAGPGESAPEMVLMRDLETRSAIRASAALSQFARGTQRGRPAPSALLDPLV